MNGIEIDDIEMATEFELELLKEKYLSDPFIRRLYRHTYWAFRLSLKYRPSRYEAQVYTLKVITEFLKLTSQ